MPRYRKSPNEIMDVQRQIAIDLDSRGWTAREIADVINKSKDWIIKVIHSQEVDSKKQT